MQLSTDAAYYYEDSALFKSSASRQSVDQLFVQFSIKDIKALEQRAAWVPPLRS